MLPLVLTVALSAAAPRGIAAQGPVELVTQVDAQLPKWLPAGAAVKPLLANRKEMEGFLKTVPGIPPALLPKMLNAAMDDQKLKADRTSFTAIRALVTESDGQMSVDLFDAAGMRCGVPLLRTEGERFVLMMPPQINERSFESIAKRRLNTTVSYLEKKDGAWAVLPLPQPPPPDCNAVLKQAAKAMYVAQMSYMAEFDGFSNQFDKIGFDEKAAGAKATVTQADAKSFSAELSLKDGVVRINHKNELTVVKPCTP